MALHNKEYRIDFDTSEVSIEKRDGDKHTLVGYAIVYNALSQDFGGGLRERFLPGAVSRSLASRDIPAFIDHQSHLILGRTSNGTLSLTNNVKGLRVEINLPDTSYARDLLISVARRDVKGMSFAFTTQDESFDVEEVEGRQTVIRSVKEATLYEVTFTANPMYLDTEVALRSYQSWQRKSKFLSPRLASSILQVLTLQSKGK